MKTGQIIKALSGFYYVRSDDGVYQTRARGKFRKQQETPLVGDYVTFDFTNTKEGRILSIDERNNELIRPMIANVDVAVIVMSVVEPNFSSNLLDRYLVTLEQKNITPIIYISKCDLVTDMSETQSLLAYYKQIGYDVVLSSQGDYLEQLKRLLTGQLSVLMGQSGSGKSTLLNQLLPDLNLETAQISSYLNRGKHTTRHVEIHAIEGCYIADTPGFSAIDLTSVSIYDLPEYFIDLKDLSNACRFRGCAHVNEPNCHVKEMLDKNDALVERYRNYLKFREEIELRRVVYDKNSKEK